MRRASCKAAGNPNIRRGTINSILTVFLPQIETDLPRMGYPRMETLAWVCVVICGIPLLYLAIWRIIYNRGISKISSALLISMAMIAAILIGDLFAAGEVAFIMEIGALLEDMTTDRAKKGLKKLISLTPEKARLIQNGSESSIVIEQVAIGDTIRVLPGETIPVDGKIIHGETSVDQSVMTGESLPIDKVVGDNVFSGTLNLYGSIDFEATKVGKDSSLQKLIRMVEDADKNQAPTQRIADQWASWLVPVALFIALAAFLITKDIVRAVTVMVVFCPCALVLATPTAIMAAIGQATKHGVIIKSGEALEKMGKVTTIAFDKTGTLTYGKLEVTDIIPMNSLTEEELLTLAASAESRSEHPLAKAIVEKAKNYNFVITEVRDFKMTTGKGITATVNDVIYTLGNETFLAEKGIILDKNISLILNKLRTEGKASIIVSDINKVVGIIGLSDVMRQEAPDMISRLNSMGTKSVLLTGDHKKTAEYFAKKAGISKVCANLLPEQKVANIEALKTNGKVCMIGDGVNDAPALKIADVGVAMGAITLSMFINLIAVTLSVLGILTPTTGALVHNAGSCFVVLLAALLYDRKYNF